MLTEIFSLFAVFWRAITFKGEAEYYDESSSIIDDHDIDVRDGIHDDDGIDYNDDGGKYDDDENEYDDFGDDDGGYDDKDDDDVGTGG